MSTLRVLASLLVLATMAAGCGTSSSSQGGVDGASGDASGDAASDAKYEASAIDAQSEASAVDATMDGGDLDSSSTGEAGAPCTSDWKQSASSQASESPTPIGSASGSALSMARMT